MKNISLFILILVSLSACRKDDVNIEIYQLPQHFPTPHYQFDNYDLSEEKIQLGKQLFFEPQLSLDNSISCGSCHHQSSGFADAHNALSLGVGDCLSDRNSIGLVNLAWNTSFFWDGGVNHLELTSFAPINNVKEMNEDMNNIIDKLYAQQSYRNMFKNAFGQDTITAQRILWSLTAYMATLISAESKYDGVYTGKNQFNTSEQLGYDLFRRDCNSCHQEPLTTNFSFQNNGLDDVFSDIGREMITLDPNDKGKFKVPSLRNVALSPPYMHDGRFNTLEEVIEHYSENIMPSPTLSPDLTEGFHYSPEEKKALVDFLETLTDHFFITNSAHVK